MSQSLRVLIVEDSESDALLLQRELRRGGYAPISRRVDTSESMADALANERWDLVLADYNMPRFSGIDALEQLKASEIDIPFIIVSGCIGEDRAVAAMKAGAHDYLMKDNLARLVSAIERELREADVRRERKQAMHALKRNLERLKTLHETNLAVVSTLDVRAVLQILLEKLDLVLPALVTTVRLFNNNTSELERVACHNLHNKEWKGVESQGLFGLTKTILENRKPVTILDLRTAPRTAASEFVKAQGFVSYLGVPLIAKDEILGVVTFFTRKGHAFSNDDIEFLITLAGQAALAIHNARLYERVKKQMLELEKSNQVKDEFLSVMSHELRTPLNVIMGYIGLLRECAFGAINAGQENALEKVTKQTEHLLKMVDSILYVTSLETQALRVDARHVNLGSFLGDLKAEYEKRIEKKLRFHWDLPRDLPPLTTDPAMLKSILDSLIANAVKFTVEGSVSVAARYVSQTNCIEFKVSDTGVGIPEEKLPIIFEMFRQLDGSDTRTYGGIGIGLFIVKKFTEILGGRIGVKSEVGKGSTFTVVLPAFHGSKA